MNEVDHILEVHRRERRRAESIFDLFGLVIVLVAAFTASVCGGCGNDRQPLPDAGYQPARCRDLECLSVRCMGDGWCTCELAPLTYTWCRL